jgi:DNA-binding NtrC family response regulator
MYLLDKRRQVTIFNRGCEQLTGWAADEIVGGLCDYASPPDDAPLDRLLASLCPPPSVYDGENTQAAAFLPTKTGGSESRMLHHFPMANRDGVIDRVFTFMLPIRNPSVVNRVSAAQKLHAELAALRLSLRQNYGFSTVVTDCDSMHRVLQQIRLAATSSVSVHLTGELGTGREHLARVSHNEGELRPTSFVPLDCKRLSAVELLSTIRRLFDSQPGEAVNLPHLQTGTLFLRSVELLPRDIQQVLVDNWDATNPDTPRRVVTSSGLPIAELAQHEDLLPAFVRLCGTLEVHVPALRHRAEDLPLLTQLFVEQQNEGRQAQIEGFDESTLNKLREYHWPGNVGELAAVVSESLEQCDKLTVLPEHLPVRFRLGMDARRTSPTPKVQDMPLEPLLLSVEKEHIQTALDLCNGNRSEAARLLDITRPKLYRRMQQLGLAETGE